MLSTNKVITERKNVLDELLMERYDLAKNRICEICTEKSAQPDFEDFFKRMAEFLKKTAVILERQTTDQTEEELMQQTFFAECSRKVRLRFITPCSFKSQGVYQIFPSIRLMFQSLVNRYDAMSEKNSVFYPELLEDLEQHTMITEYRLQSRLFGVEGISIPSYQGHITLRMSGPQQMVNLMHMLLRFGTYSGIGIKTAMGMGGLQMEERKRTNENRTV